jgi:hypothetical protein
MKSIFVLALSMLISAVTFAQRGHHNHHRQTEDAAAQSEKMKNELGLTESQYSAVKNINQKYANEIAALRKDTALIRDDFHLKMKTLRDQRQTELGKVLTDDQTKKWNTLREEKRHRGREHGKFANGRHRDQVETSLGLNDDQSAKFDAEHRAFKDRVRAVATDKSLSKEKRKEKLKSLRDHHNKEVRKILNDEQYKKWENLKKDRESKTKRRLDHIQH